MSSDYPAVKKSAVSHYHFGTTRNELFTLGGFYNGSISDAGGQDDYIITSNMQGIAYIYDSDIDGNESHFYFDKGVEIVGIDIYGSGSLRLASGGVIFIGFEDDSFFHLNDGTAVDYDKFYTAVKAAITDSGSYVFGDYVDFSTIDFDKNINKSISFQGRNESNLISLGSNQIATATGGGGKDIYRVTRFQAQDATISDNSDDDLVIFEYGLRVAEVSLPAIKFIGGGATSPGMRTLTIDFATTNIYQIGDDTNLRFKGDELVTAFSATGLPVDLDLQPHLRTTWLRSDDLAHIPYGAGVLANFLDAEVTLKGHKVAAASVYFYSATGLLKDGDNTYAYGIGGNAFAGTKHDNNLAGSEGNDFIMGGEGDNHLRGGNGADTFMFAGNFGHDQITDFKSGTDTIAINNDATYSISSDSLTVTVTDKNYTPAVRGTITLNAEVADSDIAFTAPTYGRAFQFDGFSTNVVARGVPNYDASWTVPVAVTATLSARYGEGNFTVPQETITSAELVFFDHQSDIYLGTAALENFAFDKNTGRISGITDIADTLQNKDSGGDFHWVNQSTYHLGLEFHYSEGGESLTHRSYPLHLNARIGVDPIFGYERKTLPAFAENDSQGLNNGAGIDLQPQLLPQGASVEIVGISNNFNSFSGRSTTIDDFTLTEDGVLNLTAAGLDREAMTAPSTANTATLTVTIGVVDEDGGAPLVTTELALRVTALNDEAPIIRDEFKIISTQEGAKKIALTPFRITEIDDGSLPYYTNRAADVGIEFREEDNPHFSLFSFVVNSAGRFLHATAASDFESATYDGINEVTGHKEFHAIFRLYDRATSSVPKGRERFDTITLLVADIDDEDAMLEEDRGDFSASTSVGAEIFSLRATDIDMATVGNRESFDFNLLSVTLNGEVIADVFSLLSGNDGDSEATLQYNGGRTLQAGDVYNFAVETRERDSHTKAVHEVLLTVVDDMI